MLTLVDNYDLAGEASGKLQTAEMFKFLPPEK